LQRSHSRKGSPRGGGGGEKKINSNLSHLSVSDRDAIVASASPRGIIFALDTLNLVLWSRHVDFASVIIIILSMLSLCFNDRRLIQNKYPRNI